MNIERVPGRVTVIIPAFNSEKYLAATLQSVLQQSYPDVELIVVDNGSKDGTVQLVESFGERISLLVEETPGPSAARNRGLRVASGEFVAFLDADDLWNSDHIYRHVQTLQQNPSSGGTYAKFVLIDEWGERLTDFDAGEFRDTSSSEQMPVWQALLRMELHLQIGGLLFRTDLLAKMGGFEPTLRTAEDTHLMTRFSYLHGLIFVPDAPVYYRWHAAGISKDTRIPRGTIVSLELLEEREPRLVAENAYLIRCAFFLRHLSMARSEFRNGYPKAARRHYSAALRRKPVNLEAMGMWLVSGLPGSVLGILRSAKRRFAGRKGT